MSRHRAFVGLVAIASALSARAIGHYALHDIAHVMDEIAYLIQAKIFATGHVIAPVAEPRAAFNTWFIEDRTARFGIFPPGWPAILAVAVRVGLERWLGPLLHAVTVVVVGRAGERIGGARLGVVAAVVYATCPQSIVLAASLMSHGIVACAASVMVLLCTILMTERRAPLGLALASGLGLGITASTRPLCAVVLVTGLAVTLLAARPGIRAAALTLLTVGVGSAPFVAGLLAFNHVTTGSALRFPQMAYFDEHLAPANVGFFRYHKGCNDLGFGPSHGCDLTVAGARHSPMNALSNLGDNLQAWLKLIGPVLPAGVAFALWRRSRRSSALQLIVFPLAAFAFYTLYWHGGTCYGARFYHVALPATLLVVALGIDVDNRSILACALASTLAWNVYAGARAVAELSEPQWGYWGVDDRFDKTRREWTHGPAVVMVAFGADDMRNGELGFTAVVPTGAMWMLNIRAEGALAQNTPRLDDGEVVFAKFHPRLVPELQARFPNRSFWLYVSNGDRALDTITPWDPARFDPMRYRPPVDNFDGFRVAPPIEPTSSVLSAPSDELDAP